MDDPNVTILCDICGVRYYNELATHDNFHGIIDEIDGKVYFVCQVENCPSKLKAITAVELILGHVDSHDRTDKNITNYDKCKHCSSFFLKGTQNNHNGYHLNSNYMKNDISKPRFDPRYFEQMDLAPEIAAQGKVNRYSLKDDTRKKNLYISPIVKIKKEDLNIARNTDRIQYIKNFRKIGPHRRVTVSAPAPLPPAVLTPVDDILPLLIDVPPLEFNPAETLLSLNPPDETTRTAAFLESLKRRNNDDSINSNYNKKSRRSDGKKNKTKAKYKVKSKRKKSWKHNSRKKTRSLKVK